VKDGYLFFYMNHYGVILLLQDFKLTEKDIEQAKLESEDDIQNVVELMRPYKWKKLCNKIKGQERFNLRRKEISHKNCFSV
jgi:hypothetical protein